MLGDKIDSLIKTNVQIWHLATQIKKNGKPYKDMPPGDRVEIFFKIRKHNARRSKIRWAIDGDGGINETKINYGGD